MMNRFMPLSLRIWVASFVVLSTIGFTIQLAIIPYLAPALHGGDGLVANTDSVTFHRAAIEIANAINTFGWSQWSLRPQDWGHVGISSALYALTVPKPWVLVPVASALMALAVVMLVHVLRSAVRSERIAATAALSLLILPSTAMLTAQWHKDQIAIPSTIGMILGLLLIWRGKHAFAGVMTILGGTLGLWMVRDHVIEVMAAAAMIGTIAVALTIRWRVPSDVRGLIRLAIGAAGIAVISQTLPSWTDQIEVSQAEWNAWEPGHGESNHRGEDSRYLPGADDATRRATGWASPPGQLSPDVIWYRNAWIPSGFDQRLASFARVREASKRGTGHGCASLDMDVAFTSFANLFAYAPRAAVVILLAPFPPSWFGSACSGGGRLLPLVSAVEMVIAYCAFTGIPLLLWQFRRQPEIWFIVAVSLAALVIHGFIFVNVGTIFRIRYAWFTTLIALGVAGWLTTVSRPTRVSS